MRKIIIFIIALLVFFIIGFGSWFIPLAFIDSSQKTTITINIQPNSGIKTIAQNLKNNQVITSVLAFRIYSQLDPQAKKIKAGEYQIKIGASYQKIIQQLALGPEKNEIQIKILEGWTLLDISKKLSKYSISTLNIKKIIGDQKTGQSFDPLLRKDFLFLKELPPQATLEGYLFPDTYRVWESQLPQGLIYKQLHNFENKTKNLVNKTNLDKHQLLILASILEKEGQTLQEKKMIARIFLNRLKINMPLQSDATINYITQGGRARPTNQDLQVDSKFNTYQNKGLPPGPICNPGLDSIKAAYNPADNDYYYYLHDKNGKIYYAHSLEEHKKNRWQAYHE